METPSADSRSTPSSVDPNADPLAECSQCGTRSRRAWSKGLCPECAETDLENLSCGFDCDNPAEFRLPDAKPCCEPCGEEIRRAMRGE